MSILKNYKVCFIGRTGNGKTTLINSMFGTQFCTDPLVPCTKELYSVTLIGCCPKGYDSITIFDTPGIGEFSSNSQYLKYYQYAVNKSNCIVLVSTFDRTDAPAQRLLLQLKSFIKNNDVKFIVALNHIDSTIVAEDREYIAWNNDENMPTPLCSEYIKLRTDEIHKKFDGKFLPFCVIPVCGIRNYNIVNLLNEIKQ